MTEKNDDLNASDIKALANSSKVSSTTYDLVIPEGACRVVFACPKTSTGKLSSVKDVNGLGAEIAGSFKEKIISIGGVNDKEPIEYSVFILDYAKLIERENTYKIVI